MRSYDEDGNKTCDGRVPVSVRRRFTDQDTVEDEVTETELHSTFTNTSLAHTVGLSAEKQHRDCYTKHERYRIEKRKRSISYKKSELIKKMQKLNYNFLQHLISKTFSAMCIRLTNVCGKFH